MASCCTGQVLLGQSANQSASVVSPRPGVTFSVPVEFEEAAFGTISEYYGCANGLPVAIGDTTYVSKSLELDNLRCGLDAKSMKYTGFADFRLVDRNSKSSQRIASDFDLLLFILGIQ